jgi:hypothetical protein
VQDEKVFVQKNQLAMTREEGEVVKQKVGEKEDVLVLSWLHDEPPFGHGLVLDHRLFLHERCQRCHCLYS